MKFRGTTHNGQPATTWKRVYQECAKHGEFVVEVRKYDEAREISLQQMRWLHCPDGPFAVLAEYMGVSRLIAELILKKKCGERWFVQEVDGEKIIASKTMLTAKQTGEWIDNIIDFMDSIGCPVSAPDPNWRTNRRATAETCV